MINLLPTMTPIQHTNRKVSRSKTSHFVRAGEEQHVTGESRPLKQEKSAEINDEFNQTRRCLYPSLARILCYPYAFAKTLCKHLFEARALLFSNHRGLRSRIDEPVSSHACRFVRAFLKDDGTQRIRPGRAVFISQRTNGGSRAASNNSSAAR